MPTNTAMIHGEVIVTCWRFANPDNAETCMVCQKRLRGARLCVVGGPTQELALAHRACRDAWLGCELRPSTTTAFQPYDAENETPEKYVPIGVGYSTSYQRMLTSAANLARPFFSNYGDNWGKTPNLQQAA